MKKILLNLLGLVILSLVARRRRENPESTSALAPVPADYAGMTNPLGTEAATAGADVFKNNCTACHGSQGHGDGPVSTALDPAPKN